MGRTVWLFLLHMKTQSPKVPVSALEQLTSRSKVSEAAQPQTARNTCCYFKEVAAGVHAQNSPPLFWRKFTRDSPQVPPRVKTIEVLMQRSIERIIEQRTDKLRLNIQSMCFVHKFKVRYHRRIIWNLFTFEITKLTVGCSDGNVGQDELSSDILILCFPPPISYGEAVKLGGCKKSELASQQWDWIQFPQICNASAVNQNRTHTTNLIWSLRTSR